MHQSLTSSTNPMPSPSYLDRRQQLQEYFDRTAVRAWEQLTSEAPVSRIRQTVRDGRDAMRTTLLDWLPEDLSGKRLLDAGCGTGALSVEAARRGADVVGVDISPTLIGLADERRPRDMKGSIRFAAGDMLAEEHGQFDYIVAMDSLIHYRPGDMAEALGALRARTVGGDSRLLFTFAPRSAALMLLKNVGRLFPRGDRSPAIEPIEESYLRWFVRNTPALDGVEVVRTHRVITRFYKSQAMELNAP